MTIIKLRGILAAFVSLSIGAAVQAAPIVNDNVRPVTVNDAYPGEKSLQTVLDELFMTAPPMRTPTRALPASGVPRQARPRR